mgnify:CR=1 FL=1
MSWDIKNSMRFGATAFTLGLTLTIAPASISEVTSNDAADKAGKASDKAADKTDKSDKAEKSDKSDKAESKGLTPEKINKVFEKGDTYGPISSTVAGTDVAIQTWFNPKSINKENDAKIDSVLTAKKLLDTYPEITTFKYRYFDLTDKNRYFEITVVPGVVQSFAAGTLSERDLLATLPSVWQARSVTTPETGPINADTMSSVVAGPEQVERERALQDILKLEKAGVGAKPFRQLLATVEEHVRAGRNSEAHTNLSRLQQSLADQKTRLATAKIIKPTAVRGGSASNASGNSSSGSSSGIAGGTGDPLKDGIALYKKKLGDFYPHYGPLYVDRVHISDELYKRSQNGVLVDQYRGLFKQMEDTVLNNKAGLEASVRQLNTALKIPEAPRDDEYKLQQQLADSKKGVDK